MTSMLTRVRVRTLLSSLTSGSSLKLSIAATSVSNGTGWAAGPSDMTATGIPISSVATPPAAISLISAVTTGDALSSEPRTAISEMRTPKAGSGLLFFSVTR